MSDSSENCNYPEEVVFQIERNKLEDCYRAADFINHSDVERYLSLTRIRSFWEGRRRLHFHSPIRDEQACNNNNAHCDPGA